MGAVAEAKSKQGYRPIAENFNEVCATCGNGIFERRFPTGQKEREGEEDRDGYENERVPGHA